MLYYKIENLYKKCQKCKNKKKNTIILKEKDLFFYTKTFSKDKISNLFSEISNCFSFDCLDIELTKKDLKIEEDMYLYKILAK